jgi:hypothetical protein
MSRSRVNYYSDQQFARSYRDAWLRLNSTRTYSPDANYGQGGFHCCRPEAEWCSSWDWEDAVAHAICRAEVSAFAQRVESHDDPDGRCWIIQHARPARLAVRGFQERREVG